MTTQAIGHFREQVRAARAGGQALRIRGGGTKDFYGQALAGSILDTRAYSGIVAYDPTELVITARCGTPLAEIEAELAAHGQMLAFEPPHFGPGATIGGAIACGLSGPRRASSGAVRDYVLGAVMMDATGEVLRFGGQVMKNVAGYDVSRLLAGSLGTLGLVLEHSVKVMPRPVSETTLRFGMAQAAALHRLNLWAGQPLPVSASCWHDGVLHVRLSGARAAVEAAGRALGGENIGAAQQFWQDVREQQHAFFAGATTLWRLALPSTASELPLLGEQLVEWGGALRWLKVEGTDTALAHGIRQAVAAAGGHATLFRGGDKSVGVFHPLAGALDTINRRMKASFDPLNIFNPGRMY